jgi:MerR family transcriptional regulator, light-induced transcriptional regulator
LSKNQPFKERFTIQDLENLSGIRAHTIRIWEKRYNLLHPSRAGNNVRYYSQADLQKLLNISTLYNHQFKISRLASMSDAELVEQVRRETLSGNHDAYAIHALKLSMLTYNQPLFDQTIRQLQASKSFRDIFTGIFYPLLNDIGLMWQTGTITIAHEHFLSNLIRQKILLQIEHLQAASYAPEAKTFVLYLPVNEIHELGLLYCHYELLQHGYRSIYLGQSVPVHVLHDLQAHYAELCFVTSFTIEPADDKLKEYMKEISTSLLRPGKDEFWASGRKIQALPTRPRQKGIKYIKSPDEFLKLL